MRCLWLLAISLSAAVATICPDGGECPGVETCCKLSGGKYGCCPFQNATCCTDHEHCCPSGYSCLNSSCIKSANSGSSENDLMEADKSKTCPNKQEVCPKVFTCCPTEQAGRYGCCPVSNAVCCEDNIHCCPQGFTCDLAKQMCDSNGKLVPLISKSVSMFKTAPATPANTICPDPHYSCPGADSCCRTPAGSWTCCMYPHGTCCTDGLHCCPYGMICLQSLYCIKGNVTLPTQASPFANDNIHIKNYIICPNAQECPNGNTCCKMSGGKYGCCPLPNAVCCEDDIHCCPHGFICNVQSRNCSNGFIEVPWREKNQIL